MRCRRRSIKPMMAAAFLSECRTSVRAGSLPSAPRCGRLRSRRPRQPARAIDAVGFRRASSIACSAATKAFVRCERPWEVQAMASCVRLERRMCRRRASVAASATSCSDARPRRRDRMTSSRWPTSGAVWPAARRAESAEGLARHSARAPRSRLDTAKVRRCAAGADGRRR